MIQKESQGGPVKVLILTSTHKAMEVNNCCVIIMHCQSLLSL